LKKEAESNEQKAAVYFVRSQSRYIANDIRRKVASTGEDDRRYKRLKEQSDQKVNSLEAVEQYLRESNHTSKTESPEDSLPHGSPSDGGIADESGEKGARGADFDSDSEDSGSDDDATESQNY
jgi:hypothetical protein